MNANKTVTANFVVQYTLTTSVSGQGTVSPAGGAYDSGATVWLTATPAAGWRFKEWTGGLTGTTSPALLTMNGNKSVQAVFLPEYTLTVTTGREGTVNPSSGTYISGTNVTVTATPAADTRFDHWEGDVPLGQEQSNPLASTMDTNIGDGSSTDCTGLTPCTCGTCGIVISRFSINPTKAFVLPHAFGLIERT